MKGNVVSIMTTIGSPVGHPQYQTIWLLTPNAASERLHGSLHPIPKQHATD